MAKHSIDTAMLAEHNNSNGNQVERRTIRCEAPYARRKADLLGAVADAYGCKVVLIQQPGQGADRILELYGFRTDLEHVETLFTSLCLQAVRSMHAQAGSSRSYRADFFRGFAHRVHRRLIQARQQARTDYEHSHTGGPSVGLVLRSRANLIQDAIRDAHPNVRFRKQQQKVTSLAGLSDGQHAGNSADLHQTRLTGRRALPPN